MRKIKEILRLRFDGGLSVRQIARSCQLGKSAVSQCLGRFARSALEWPAAAALEEAALERALYAAPAPVGEVRAVPAWPAIHRELRRPGVTLSLLWQEYKAVYPEGFQYSWFCAQYRAWAGKLDVVMRQEHRAGEKLFVDYAGQTVAVVERTSGQVRSAQVFVAVLGASNYTYAEATWSQALADWIGSHQRALAFFGAVPEVVVPDNLRSGVHRAHRYEPDLNPTYQDLARHYGFAVLPARVRRPRDKAKVEVGVQVVERWILAALRQRTFFSLVALNAAIAELLERLNARPFKHLPGSRRSLFETLERPALKALPASAYVYAEWHTVRVPLDYHVALDGHHYSVPHALVGKALDTRLTATTVECFHRGQRVASHPRSAQRGQHTTTPEHMPEAHRQIGQWTPQRLVEWAARTGPGTEALVRQVLASRRHRAQNARSCLGILRLGASYGEARLEAACQRALALGTHSYRSIESILKHRLEAHPGAAPPEPPASVEHDNLRGPSYYH